MRKGKLATIILALLCVAIIAAWIYAFVEYGGKPITEIPTWALWLIFGK